MAKTEAAREQPVKGLYNVEAPDLTVSNLPKEFSLAEIPLSHTIRAKGGVWVKGEKYPLAEVIEWLTKELVSGPQSKAKLFSQGQPSSMHFASAMGIGELQRPSFIITVSTPVWDEILKDQAEKRKNKEKGNELVIADAKGVFWDQKSSDYAKGRFGIFEFIIPHDAFVAYKTGAEKKAAA